MADDRNFGCFGFGGGWWLLIIIIIIILFGWGGFGCGFDPKE